MTSLGSTTPGYRGCLLLRFADVDAGALSRCGSAPAVVASFGGDAGLFSGACTFAVGASRAGVMGLSAAVSRSAPFQLWASGVDVH